MEAAAAAAGHSSDPILIVDMKTYITKIQTVRKLGLLSRTQTCMLGLLMGEIDLSSGCC